jgi:hypothetical protein
MGWAYAMEAGVKAEDYWIAASQTLHSSTAAIAYFAGGLKEERAKNGADNEEKAR